MARLVADRHAATAAEFAMIMPVFAVMMTATVQYGLLGYTYNASLNATRSAVRAVALSQVNEADGEQRLREGLPAWVNGGGGSGGGSDPGVNGIGNANGNGGNTGNAGNNGNAGGNGNGGNAGTGTGNGNGNGIGSPNAGNGGNGAGSSGDVVVNITDAAAGQDVLGHVEIPARRAAIMTLAPMPETLTINVRMVKEG